MNEPSFKGVLRVLGIDFGTSTTLIKVKTYVDGKSVGAEELSDYVRFDGVNTAVPSVVCDAYGEFLFGHQALHNKEQGEFFANFKLDLIGTDRDTRIRAEKLVTYFFKYLYEEYDTQRPHFPVCDSEITYVSYPAKWPKEVSKTMLEIARKAGFHNVYGIDEPSAAIHTVMIQQSTLLQKLKADSANVLMIDMGAGTTDLAICHYTARDKKVEILNTWPQESGVFFGGREVENALWIYVKKYLADCGIAKINNESQLIPSCKAWKEANISPALNKGRTVENCAFVAPMLNMYGEQKPFPPISREKFETLLEEYLCQLPTLINDLIYNTPDISHEDVDLVILTGGHSQWYFTNEIVSGVMIKFGEVNLPKVKTEPWRLVELSLPQETVSLGMVYQPINAAERLKAQEAKPLQILEIEQEPSVTSNAKDSDADKEPMKPPSSTLISDVTSIIREKIPPPPLPVTRISEKIKNNASILYGDILQRTVRSGKSDGAVASFRQIKVCRHCNSENDAKNILCKKCNRTI